jgi:hypothetical protein
VVRVSNVGPNGDLKDTILVQVGPTNYMTLPTVPLPPRPYACTLCTAHCHLHHENPEIDLLLSIVVWGSESPGDEEVGFYYFKLLYMVLYVV